MKNLSKKAILSETELSNVLGGASINPPNTFRVTIGGKVYDSSIPPTNTLAYAIESFLVNHDKDMDNFQFIYVSPVGTAT